MQQRNKWTDIRKSLKPGDMVIMRDELCPPSTWPLALVEKVHLGADGLVRVATIRTSDSRFMRPIVKLIKLPTDLKLKSDSQPEVKKN
ncbi:hypothetical protein TKK_0002091 [Trichogramma kaykai]|uniref:DUF5641 domain-containing protein n=1 Tax=Trichogramma kaykai TaxID=54128 RepID=A0ABD2X7P2_9HYME